MSKRARAEAHARFHHWINQHTGQCVTMDQLTAAARTMPPHETQNIVRLMLNNKTAEFCCHPDGQLVVPHRLHIIGDAPAK